MLRQAVVFLALRLLLFLRVVLMWRLITGRRRPRIVRRTSIILGGVCSGFLLAAERGVSFLEGND